jgi:hypothetical protein
MTASFCEKPTEIRERLNSSGSDDFGPFSFRSKIDKFSFVKEWRSEGLF